MRPLFLRATFVAFLAAPVAAQQFTAGHLFAVTRKTNEVFEFTGNVGTAKIPASAGLAAPWGLAFGPDGALYVSSIGGNRIYRFDAAGNSTNFGSGFLVSPRSIAFGPNGNLYVADSGLGRVVEITPAGTKVREIGEDAGLVGPFGVTFGPEGHLYVTDSASQLIREFDPSGPLVRSIGEPGDLSTPIALTLDVNAQLVCTSQATQTIALFDAAGSVTKWDPLTTNAGKGWGLAFGPDSLLYVSNPDAGILKLDASGGPAGVLTPAGDDWANLAFAPYRFAGKLSGTVRRVGEAPFNRNENVVVSYSPGSRAVMVKIIDDPENANDLATVFSTNAMVFYGFETIGSDGAKKRTFRGLQTDQPSRSEGFASADLAVTGKLGTAGDFIPTKLMGPVDRATSGVSFSGKLTTTKLLK